MIFKDPICVSHVSLYHPAGSDVFQSIGHYRRLLDSSQWSRGGVQAESPQQISAVHWTGFPGSLPHLHGRFCFWSSLIMTK